MAYSVLQGVQSPNAGRGLLQAFSQGQDIYARGQQNQLRQQQIRQGDYESSLRKLQIVNKLAKKAITLPPEGVEQLLSQYSGALLSVGFSAKDLAETPRDKAGLQNLIDQTDSVLAAAMPQYRKESINTNQGLMVFDPVSGEYRSATGQDGKPLRGAQYDADLQANISGAKAGASTAAELETRRSLEPQLKGDIKAEEQRVMAETEPEIKSAERTAVQGAEQRTIYKNQALAAAENIPTLRRAIQLQEEINSGGGANSLRKMANYLGVSSADEGELNSLFGQNILGQLKSTFGGNPTEGERLALEQAQASFSQTGRINIRLLNNALKLADLRVRRGRQAAQSDNDNDTLGFIDDAISIDFSDETSNQQKVINWGDLP